MFYKYIIDNQRKILLSTITRNTRNISVRSSTCEKINGANINIYIDPSILYNSAQNKRMKNT